MFLPNHRILVKNPLFNNIIIIRVCLEIFRKYCNRENGAVYLLNVLSKTVEFFVFH